MANKKKRKANRPRTIAAPASDKLAQDRAEFEEAVEEKSKPASKKEAKTSEKDKDKDKERRKAKKAIKNAKALRNTGIGSIILGVVLIALWSVAYFVPVVSFDFITIRFNFIILIILGPLLIVAGVVLIVWAMRKLAKAKEKLVVKSRSKAKDPKTNKKPNIFRRFVEYLKQVRLEIKRTTWPTRNEVLNMTIIVLVALIFFGVLIFAIDFVMVQLLNLYGHLIPAAGSTAAAASTDTGTTDTSAIKLLSGLDSSSLHALLGGWFHG